MLIKIEKVFYSKVFLIKWRSMTPIFAADTK